MQIDPRDTASWAYIRVCWYGQFICWDGPCPSFVLAHFWGMKKCVLSMLNSCFHCSAHSICMVFSRGALHITLHTTQYYTRHTLGTYSEFSLADSTLNVYLNKGRRLACSSSHQQKLGLSVPVMVKLILSHSRVRCSDLSLRKGRTSFGRRSQCTFLHRY